MTDRDPDTVAKEFEIKSNITIPQRHKAMASRYRNVGRNRAKEI